ncbi:MAG TPA: ATP-binding cassette domain-containing protein, partial [Planctomycetes bacterium]|nr:ATP-binding cassette domain-containing protein [Planctomycetota bacterium]
MPRDYIRWRHCVMSSSTPSPVGSLQGVDLVPHSVERRPATVQQREPESSSCFAMATSGLVKTYRKGKLQVEVLRSVDFGVRHGEFQAVIGQSGSGKSTLLHLLATLDEADEGEIFFEGNRIDNLPAASRDILRNRYLGMVFQFYHLLPELNILENVLMPLMISHGVFRYWYHKRSYVQRAKHLLDLVGLS